MDRGVYGTACGEQGASQQMFFSFEMKGLRENMKFRKAVLQSDVLYTCFGSPRVNNKYQIGTTNAKVQVLMQVLSPAVVLSSCHP